MTCRYDFLGINGNRWIDTKDLDAFGIKCCVFDNCYTGTFPTIPHRTDMLTGRSIFPYAGWFSLRKDWIPVTEYLHEVGYVAQLICDTPHLLKRGYNFGRGFDGYFWTRGQESDIPFIRMNYPIKRVMPHGKTRCDYKLKAKPERSPGIPFETTLLDSHAWVNRDWIYQEGFMVKTAQHTIPYDGWRTTRKQRIFSCGSASSILMNRGIRQSIL